MMKMEDVVYLIDYIRHDNVREIDTIINNSLEPLFNQLASVRKDVNKLNELLEHSKKISIEIPEDMPF